MPNTAPSLSRFLAVAFLAAVLFGCATPPDRSDKEAYAEFEAINDPLEPLNRTIFSFNQAIDAMFLRPWADFYRLLLPPPLREGIHNILNNLRSPIILANDLMQGEFERAGTTTGRFLINTTLGVGGIADWASDFGLPYHNEDFGQTLAVWGAPEGPFLIVPLLGPSNPRDALGIAVDNLLIDPIVWWVRVNPDDREWLQYVRTSLTILDVRAQTVDELDDLQKSSLDYYAALRSLYRQFRTSEIYQGQPPPPEEGPRLDDFPAIPLE
ncbi:MAG: VacJ family lipoprotein [Rhodospirillales bacterium]|nr:VacJ family lipoprotein [Rhodospirillales bacterium]